MCTGFYINVNRVHGVTLRCYAYAKNNSNQMFYFFTSDFMKIIAVQSERGSSEGEAGACSAKYVCLV